MSENPIVELKKEDRELLKSFTDGVKALQSSPEPEKTEEGHKTLADWMECKNCNPSDQYPRVKKTLLKIMGQKECKECGNIDRGKEEYCSDCGEEYGKSE